MTKLSDVKSRELLWEFMDYCIKNPEQRFWQALRNWSSFAKIYGEVDGGAEMIDTFYEDKK